MSKVLVAECVLCGTRLQWLKADGLKGLQAHAETLHPDIVFPWDRYETGLAL